MATFDAAAALKAGYSENDIADFLGKQHKFNTAAALQAGYTPADIIKQLSGPPPTTLGGNIKEFGKGIVPGAIGLLESAGTGAAALLPEEMEKSARAGIQSTAAAAKKPFEAAPGYEESIGRKFGEAVGSTVPFFATGPLGLAGRLGATALGVGAGAGEARTRAEQEGATGGQRAGATALGAAVGATEMLPVFHFIEKLASPMKQGIMAAVGRAAATGGAEGAQEAAAQIAQNLIAKGIYKPDQAIIEQVGESAAYGGATGALIQAITDMALGRRAGAGRTTPGQPGQAEIDNDARIKQLKQEQLGVKQGQEARKEAALTRAKGRGVQGELFSGLPKAEDQRDLFGNLISPLPSESAQEATANVPEGQMDLGLEGVRGYAELEAEKQQLLNLKKQEKDSKLPRKERTQGIDERVAEITAMQKDFVRLSDKTKKGTQGSLFTPQELTGLDTTKGVGVTPVEAPKQTKQRAGVAPAGEQLGLGIEATREYPDLIQERERLSLLPQTPEIKARLADLQQQTRDRDLFEVDRLYAAKAEAAEQEAKQAESAFVAPDEQPVPEPTKVEKPKALMPDTVPTVVSPDVLGALGIGRTAIIRKPDHGIMGKDIADPAQAAEVKSILEAYREGRSAPIQEKIDAYLARPEFQGAPDAGQTVDTTGGAGPTAPEQADTGSAPTRAAEPERDGMVPAEPNAQQPDVGESQPAAPVEEAQAPAEIPAETPAEPKKPKGMFDQLVSRETNPDAPEVKAENIKLKSLPTTFEDKETSPLIKQLLNKAHPFDIPNTGAWRATATEEPESRGAQPATDREAVLQEKAKAGDVRGALQAIIDAPGDTYTELDKLVAKRLLASNSLPTVAVVEKTSTGADGLYNAITDHIELAEGALGSHTLLHELVHGFLHRLIGLHEGKIVQNMHVANLRNLYDFIGKNHPELLKTYGMTNLSEFASEAMANKDFQDALKQIKYQRQSIFTAFARGVLRILGLSPTEEHTALAAALISAESVMTEGRKIQEAATGTDMEGALPSFANAVTGFDEATYNEVNNIASQFGVDAPQAGGVLNQGLQGVKRAAEKGGIVTTFRQAVADKFATVESKVSNMFSQGVRDAFGNLNPMQLIRQAEDSAKVIMDFFHAGGIRLNKDGLTETFEAGASATAALRQLQKFAQGIDKSFDEAKNYVSTVFEGHRLHGLRDFNGQLEQSAKLLEAQGKNKEADAERARKVSLHMTDAEINKLEKVFQSTPAIQEILGTFTTTKNQLIDFMVETGRISKDKAADWKANSDYVPFDRVAEDIGTNPMPRGKGLAVLTRDPKIKGSLERPIKNTIDSYMNTLGWMVKDAMQNHAAINLLETMAGAGYAQKHLKPEMANNRNLVVPRLFKNGEAVHYEVQNEFDLAAFQQAPELTNWLIKGLESTSRTLRTSVTAMPPFAVKQVIEDAMRAMMFSGVERPLVVAMKTLYNLPRTFFGELTGRKAPAVKRMEALGIIGDFDFNIYQPTTEIEKEIGAKKRGVAGTVFHTLEKFTKASDLAARLAVYEETMRETNGDEVLAQHRARELINFNRRGTSSSMRVLSRVVPFFNAYAQGLDVLYRSASGIDSTASGDRAAARKLFMSRMALMTAMGFAYAIAMSDDDGYKNATDDVRDSNWILPGGYKLPTAKELGFLYKVIPERIVEYYRRSGTPEEQSAMDALSGIVKAAMSAYGSPTAVPSAIRPILENMTNYSFFLQRELESASMQAKEPGQRFSSSTSELAKAIGDATNVSPIKLDNLFKGIFGMAGSTTLMATDAILNPTRPDRPLYQMPFANIFLYDTIGGRAKTEFYDLRERTAMATSTFNDMMKTNPEKAGKYFEDHANLIAVAPMVNSSLQELNNLRRMRTMIEQGSDEMLGLKGDERRTLIDELRQAENDSVRYVRELEASIK